MGIRAWALLTVLIVGLPGCGGQGPLQRGEQGAAPAPLTVEARAAAIVDKIALPDIPDRDFNIVDCGARPGEDANSAIKACIETAAAAGGGRVVLPPGLWLSNGPVVLKSRINLHISEGATLLFGPEPADYLPAVLTRWEGTEMYGYSPMIYAHAVEDVAITGKGTIDGNAASKFHGFRSGEKDSQLQLRRQGIEGEPVEQRQYHRGHYLRPSLIQLVRAERVLLEDYLALNSPFWVNHLVYTDHAVMRGVRVDSHWPNNDGVDVDSSSYVLIENCWFRTGDDSVVVKSGRDLDGRRIGIPSEYVVARNNDMGGEDGIALGSEMSGDIREVYFLNNLLREGVSAIRFKSNLDRGGVVENIYVKNLDVESFDNLFWFQLDYPGVISGRSPPLYQNILFENVRVQRAGSVLEVTAAKGHPLKNVIFRNVEILQAGELFELKNASDIVFDGLRLNGAEVNGRLDWLE